MPQTPILDTGNSLVNELVKRTPQDMPTGNQPQEVDSDTHSAKWPMTAALLGGLGDVVTTQMGLARGAREQNPLLPQNRLGNGLMLGGSYLANALLTKLLNDHGHDKLAKMLGYGGAIDGALSTVHNIGTLRSMSGNNFERK